MIGRALGLTRAGEMNGRLSYKIALITGGSRGIGMGIAERLAADGAHVIINCSGRVANISSTSSMARVPGPSTRAGPRTRVKGSPRIWAAEMAPRHVAVNAVQQVAQSLLSGCMGAPSDIANAIGFFASGGEWKTGLTLAPAGGAA